MFAKPEFTEVGRFPGDGEAKPWLAKKKPADDPKPEDDALSDTEDDLDGGDGDLDADDLDDELDDDDLDDEEDDDDLDDLDDDLIELDDEYDKEEEEKQRPAHPGKYDD